MSLKKWSFSDQSKINFSKKAVLLFLFFQGITTVQAQQSTVISLNDALKIAKENNKAIQKSHIEQRISEKEIAETKNIRLPEINFSAMYSRLSDLTEYEGGFFSDKHTYTPEPGTLIYDAVTKFDMPLYAGNRINNAIKKSKEENEIAKIKLEKTQNDIQLQVTATFLGIYKMMELQKIIDESIKEEQERLKEVKTFKTFGTVTKNEVLRSELQLSVCWSGWSFRSFLGSILGFAIIQNAGVFLQRTHFTKLRQFVLPESPETQMRIEQLSRSFMSKGYTMDDSTKLAMKQIIGLVSKQSVLLSNMEIFSAIGYLMLIVVIFLLVNQHLRQKINIFKNRIWGN
jgi:hypothetical protein